MIRIDLTENVEQAMQRLNVLQKQQLPFAIARSLTRTAAEFSMDALPKVMEQQIDRPTPFTKRAGRYLPATKENQTAVVYLADLQDRYLRFQVRGGSRIQKGFERKYESIAETIASRQLVPGSGAKKDKYGNVSRYAIQRLGEEAQVKGSRIYIGELKGGGPFGIWRRYKTYEGKRKVGKVQAVFVEPANLPNYNERLRLQPELEKFASDRFDFHFAASTAMLD